MNLQTLSIDVYIFCNSCVEFIYWGNIIVVKVVLE